MLSLLLQICYTVLKAIHRRTHNNEIRFFAQRRMCTQTRIRTRRRYREKRPVQGRMQRQSQGSGRTDRRDDCRSGPRETPGHNMWAEKNIVLRSARAGSCKSSGNRKEKSLGMRQPGRRLDRDQSGDRHNGKFFYKTFCKGLQEHL